MIERNIRVSESIQARPAALLVQTVSKFSSTVKIKKEDKIINAKSIMGVIALGILSNQNIVLCIDGVDEELAAIELTDFLTKAE